MSESKALKFLWGGSKLLSSSRNQRNHTPWNHDGLAWIQDYWALFSDTHHLLRSSYNRIFYIFNLSWFSKNKWSNQNFRQMYICRCGPRRLAPAANPRALSPCRPGARRQPRALSPCRPGARRQEHISCARPCIAAPGPYHRGARRQEPVAVGLGGRVFVFSFWFLKHF
jgi:hypothetical protein